MAKSTHDCVKALQICNTQTCAREMKWVPERMVRSRRLELPRELPHSDLNAARLPIPPRPHCPGNACALGRSEAACSKWFPVPQELFQRLGIIFPADVQAGLMTFSVTTTLS